MLPTSSTSIDQRQMGLLTSVPAQYKLCQLHATVPDRGLAIAVVPE